MKLNIFSILIQTHHLLGSIFDTLTVSLPVALGIAASPWPIIALMVLLMTPRALSNAYSFLLGWWIGLMLVGIVVLYSPGLQNESGDPSVLMGWIRLGIGILCLVVGLLIMKDIPGKGSQVSAPKWMDRVDSYGFFQAFSIGFFLSAINFKNASMVATGASSIGGFGMSHKQELLVLLLFSLVSSIGVFLPPAIFLLFRKRAGLIFGKMKIWLLRNRAMILFIVLVLFGGISVYKGIQIVRF